MGHKSCLPNLNPKEYVEYKQFCCIGPVTSDYRPSVFDTIFAREKSCSYYAKLELRSMDFQIVCGTTGLQKLDVLAFVV